jgi:hypothetical protein
MEFQYWFKGKEVNGVYQKDPLEDKIRFDRALIISFVSQVKTFMEQRMVKHLTIK